MDKPQEKPDLEELVRDFPISKRMKWFGWISGVLGTVLLAGLGMYFTYMAFVRDGVKLDVELRENYSEPIGLDEYYNNRSYFNGKDIALQGIPSSIEYTPGSKKAHLVFYFEKEYFDEKDGEVKTGSTYCAYSTNELQRNYDYLTGKLEEDKEPNEKVRYFNYRDLVICYGACETGKINGKAIEINNEVIVLSER